VTNTNVGCATPSFSASTVRTGDAPAFVVLGDFNFDGKPDLAVANQGSDNVILQLNTCTVTNTPTIGGATLARQQGAAGTISAIATVSDAQDSAGTLKVTATSVPAGLSVTGITNTNGTVTATVAAACRGPGDRSGSPLCPRDFGPTLEAVFHLLEVWGLVLSYMAFDGKQIIG
jgi:hypothetical protein